MSRCNNKWIFLNLTESNYEGIDKLSVAEEVKVIERFADYFKCGLIISKGSDEILRIKEEVDANESLRNDCRLKRLINKNKKDTSAIKHIKKSLGV